MAIWKLTIEDDEGQKTVVPLVRDEYTIGRREGHAIRLTERNVSRDHAKIRKDPADGYLIEDLGSYNGVFINGHRLAEAQKLQSGDLILIGDFRIESHNDDAPARALPIPSSLKAVPSPSAKPDAQVDRPSRLVLLTGNEGGKEYPLDKPRMIVGRGDDVDVRINHNSVSRHHCEIHSPEPGQFEVLDQASANGIRVNGQEVKRALLNPGDTLELGDVQLKYIAAGQSYLFDAAAAAAAREFESKSRKKSGATTWVIIAVLVAGAGIGGVVLAKQGGKDDSSPSGTSSKTGNATGSGTKSEDLLASAMKLKDKDPYAAHDQISGIEKDSPARKDPRFKEIENAWADKALKKAEGETDDQKKKEIVKEVLGSGADESYRTSASDMLDAIEKKSGPIDVKTTVPTTTVEPTTTKPVPTTTTTAPTVTATTTATVKPTATATATTTATATVKPTATATTTAAATGTPGNCPSWKGDYSAAMRAKDYECVRTILMPRLNANSISSGEARYLKAACAALADSACQKRAADKI